MLSWKQTGCKNLKSSNLFLSAGSWEDKIFGELAERYRTGLLSQGWGNTQVSSPESFRDYTLRKKLFDDKWIR